MKTNIRYTSLFFLLPVFCLLLFTESCKKASDTTDPQQPNGEFWLKGSVINSGTHTGIANAQVYFAGQTVLTTDANGQYKVSCSTIGSGNYDVRVMANGYGFGFATATITKDAAMVNAIVLSPLADAVPVGSSGGSIMMADPECLVPGSQTTLIVPAGAFTGNVNVTFTRFTGIDVPGYAPANTLNLCTVNLGPAGTVAAKELEILFALPFTNPAVDNLPLMRYNFEANTWENTGTLAQVDHATNMATMQTTAFGTYSLGIAGTFTESAGSSTAAVVMPLDPNQSAIDLSYTAKNEYSGFTLETISLSYLKNIASQNTRINGTRASFNDVTTLTFNYIGSKPDSLAQVKTAGYYRWVPKVSYTTATMPMTTTIQGVAVNGTIVKQVYVPASGYEYVHDQGGGGK